MAGDEGWLEKSHSESLRERMTWHSAIYHVGITHFLPVRKFIAVI